MKTNEIEFPHDVHGSLAAMMTNKYSADQAIVAECAESAGTVDEFIEAYLAREEEAGKQFYQAIIRYERPERRWRTIRANFGSRCIKTISDVGSVKVGTDNFSVLIENRHGDGETRVAIFDIPDEFKCEDLMIYATTINAPGEANIYSYDCGDRSVAHLHGRFDVYVYDGLVAFVRTANQ